MLRFDIWSLKMVIWGWQFVIDICCRYKLESKMTLKIFAIDITSYLNINIFPLSQHMYVQTHQSTMYCVEIRLWRQLSKYACIRSRMKILRNWHLFPKSVIFYYFLSHTCGVILFAVFIQLLLQYKHLNINRFSTP